jgi:hypothetical protein
MADSHEAGTVSAQGADSGTGKGKPPGSQPPGSQRRGGRPPLRAWQLIAAAARAGRGDAARILAVSIAVSVLTAGAEIAAEHAADPHSAWQEAVGALLAEGIGILGTVFLSGFLCRLTGEAGHGRSPVTIRRVLRTLPWGRLILADVIVAVVIVAGLLALVIPGLIAASLLAVTGPVIEIEDQTARAALRRSARLVWPYFWQVALLATLPVILLGELEAAGPEPSGAPEIAEVLAIRGVIDGMLEAVVTLVLIQLACRLIDLDRGRPEAGGRGQRRQGTGRVRRKRPAAGEA